MKSSTTRFNNTEGMGTGMKILSLVSSYRHNGNTETIVGLVEEKLAASAGARHIPLEIEHISLPKENLQPCRGCRMCFDKGEEYCPAKDGLLEIRDRLAEADALLLASPVYVEDVNGTMKNWIDRMAFYCHRPALFGKCAAVIATSGSGSSSRSLRTMANALNAWGVHVVSQNKFKMGARMEGAQARKLYEEDAAGIAKQVLDSVLNGAAEHPSFYSLIAFHIQRKTFQKKAGEHSADILYWKNNGWLEPSRRYYTEDKPNPLKAACARILGGMVMKLFIT